MFLLRKVTNRFFYESTSPYTKIKYRKNQENPDNAKNISEGASAVAFFDQKGSMTVEAAIVLPIFLFALFTLIYVGEIIRLSADDQAALMQRAMKMSTYAYSFDKVLPGDQIIDLKKTWTAKMPFVPTGARGVKLTDRARVRAFTGYDNTLHRTASSTADVTVFITDYGSVYHKTRSCHHLDLSVRSIAMSSVKSARNIGGHKYYPCERCAKRKAGSVYITDYGDSYHVDGHCPGLKRGIHAVKLSEVGSMPPCADCGS